jgi:hypothetical protein
MLYDKKNIILFKEDKVYIIVNGVRGTINHKQFI